MHSAGALPMRVFADRFLLDDADVVDLATGQIVRLWIERYPVRASIRDRLRLCDALAALRHPLLLPLVDYGFAEETWFEAHAVRPPLRMPAGRARQLALHLVRFLRSHDVELTAATSARHVRAAIEGPHGVAIGPLGWRIAWRSAVDAIRLTIESGGPPGLTRLTLAGPVGSGLRSARLALARAARLCGFGVIDGRVSPLSPYDGDRHYCIFDWLPEEDVLPSRLAHAGTGGGARHLWLRFTRGPARGTCAVPLDPLTTVEMTNMLYRDPDCGPSDEEIRMAVQQSRGWPGPLIQCLSGEHSDRRAAFVHEASPEYVIRAPDVRPNTQAGSPDAGVRRLLRVMHAAENVGARGRHARAERLLRRCADALAARGAASAAAAASKALGDVLSRRGHHEPALAAYKRARDLDHENVDAHLILAIGRTYAALGDRANAEAALRTALAHTDAAVRREAAALLAHVYVRADDCDRADELIRCHDAGQTPAGLLAIARLRMRKGDLAGAAQSARAVSVSDAPPDVLCDAYLILAQLQRVMEETEGATRSAAEAMAAARRARDRTRILLSWGIRTAIAPKSDHAAARRRRLLAAAARLPPARAEELREMLSIPHPPVAHPNRDVEMLETLLGLVETAADDERAVNAVVRHVHEKLSACSASVWIADDFRQIAAEGRPWPAAGIGRLTLNAGRSSFSAGVVTEAAEPVRAGGATIGCIGARWTAGRTPAEAEVHRCLRLAAAAIAPAVAGLNSPRRAAAVRADAPDALLGSGPAAERLRGLIARAAAAPFPVLIEGESGSGKELVARAIHTRSGRRARRFCAINCAALTEDLLEAELFGHVRGAFTGAAAERAGLFEEADQGTLFLDEAAELSARAQAKLLRVLQEGEVRRVGENLPRRVDARIVAATNRPLEAEVEGGRFRADLRFRLDVIRIVVPPLRDRADEIPALAERIWRDAAARVGTRATLGSDLILALARYTWPGNVRELQNVLAALAVHAPARGRVPVSLLPARIAETAGRLPLPFDEARVEFERRFIQAALARAAGRKGIAAAQLGVSRQGLDKMLKRLGIS